MTNKYVCVNDQTCSAKINALLLAKSFFFGIFMDQEEFEVNKIAKHIIIQRTLEPPDKNLCWYNII